MISEGYASVTTRRVAGIVGLTPALVHYYFPTTDDLLVAAYRRAAERHDGRILVALGSDRPLHALWNLYSDPSRMALGVEFMALANHRKVIRAEIVQHDQRDRERQAGVLAGILADSGVDRSTCEPLCAVMLLGGMSRALVMEEVLGISCAHAQTRAFVERLLAELEKTRKSRARLGHAKKKAATRPRPRRSK